MDVSVVLALFVSDSKGEIFLEKVTLDRGEELGNDYFEFLAE
jgi:hypothetical protein